MRNNSVCHAPYLRNHISYNCHLWYTSVEWCFFQCFCHFSKFWFFVFCVKGQKMTQNDKKFGLSSFMYQEPYLIWLLFVVHKCKMMISLGVFFHFFKILIFQVVRRVEDQKMAQNVKKLSVCISQEPYYIWYLFRMRLCKKIIYIFSKF